MNLFRSFLIVLFFTLSLHADDSSSSGNIVSVADASMQSPTQDAIMTFSVTLSGTLSSGIDIHYETVDDTAVIDVDYEAVEGTLIVPAGTTSADINVTIKAGASGKFKLLLDNAYGASISDGEAIGSVYSEYGLCYAGSTGNNIGNGKCILAGAFYSATNKTPHDCDAQVTIVNRDGDALSSVSVFKIYDSNANNGAACSGGDSCNGPSIRSISGFPDHNSGYEYIWPSFAGDSNQTVTDSDTWSSSGDFDDIILYGSYTKDGLNYAQKISSCGGGGGYIEEGLGNGDFIDTNINTAALSNAYNASTDTSSLGLKFIKTKIASETTPLTAVYLNDFGVNADYDNNSSGDVDKKLWFAIPVLNDLDATGGCPSANSSLLQQIIDPDTNLQAIFTIKDSGASDYSQTKEVIIPANASKNAKIEMIIVDTSKLNEDAQNCVEVSSTTGNLEGLGQCVNSAVQYVDAYGQTAYERCAINDTYGKPCLSQNNGVGTGLFNSPLGCFMCTFYAGTACSSDDFAIRPNDFNATIAPNEIFTAGNPKTITFRADNSVGDPTNNYNEVEDDSFFVDVNISDSSKVCQEPSINFSPSVNFTNGTVTDNYTLHNVGDFNVTIAERVGYEFALVDADDTLDLADRLITPYTQQIKVIPHHFGIVGGLKNGSNGFTYLSNFEQNPYDADRNVSASFDLNISAQKADNNITSNYTALCYAKDGNLTISLAEAIDPNPANSLTKLLWYHYTPDDNGSIPLNGTNEYNLPFSSTQFDSTDANGTAEFNYKINFDRNLTKVVNPFMVVVDETNATDTDNVNGVNSVDTNATFVFGRTHASIQRYSVPEDYPYPANIYFESYCSGTDCVKTLLPNG
ncbi:Calx-beta domain-containing protein, partial [Sulfurimonas sp.]|uniref:Calx-beta domain-containing protein n=1 Tax=Sulfurimonas sp. TaxID=2022749 RepID=UPI0019EB0259